MLWIKALHIVFIASWFAGLFYLPRIFVNLAQETDLVARERLLGMARRLYRFTGMISLVALVLGVWLLALTWSFWKGPGNGWLHAKLFLVVSLVQRSAGAADAGHRDPGRGQALLIILQLTQQSSSAAFHTHPSGAGHEQSL
jgi:uncharacterized membrane protein